MTVFFTYFMHMCCIYIDALGVVISDRFHLFRLRHRIACPCRSEKKEIEDAEAEEEEVEEERR